MAQEWGSQCILIVVGRDVSKLEQTVSLAAALGTVAFALPADLTIEQQVRELFDEVKSRFGRLDLLFNNAGKSLPVTAIEDLELKDWEDVLKINLTASFLCTKYAIRIMKEQTPQGGRIINNGSIAAYAPRPGALAYTCSKHGISGLTKSTALDGRKHNIACGQVDIGNTMSDMTANTNKGLLQADGSIKPEPVCDVADVARAVLYMASLPLATNVLNMTVMATTMPFIGRG
jgi:NAD(P)-dependent dehydrogenase (short-subunit alcohol dehydrogenase family)